MNTKAALDYETKNSYTVTVTADDSSGEANNSANITVRIMVTDLDERPTIKDKIDAMATARQSVSYKENDTQPVLTLTASDPERVTPIVWSMLEDLGVAVPERRMLSI